MRRSYYTAALLAALALVPGESRARPQGQAAATRYTVFLSGTPVGTEDVTFTRDPGGSTISGSSRLGPPVGVQVHKATIRYDTRWQPIDFALDAAIRDQWTSLYTRFADGSAVSDIRETGRQTTRTAKVAPDTVVLSNTFFGAYHALTARLAGLAPGAELHLYYAPQSEVVAKLEAVADEQFRTGSVVVRARRFALTLTSPGGPLAFELWADQDGGLIRLSVPAQSLEVVRSDIASVATRRETMTRPNDEVATIPGSGFNIAGTVSKPAGFVPAKNRRLPAVVLVGGTGPADRDETTGDVAIFAELADAIADAGFLVVRYDRRGAGQSGGRSEAATLTDYADDVRSVVKYLQRRKDVDKKRIAVVGHGEGGWIALTASRGHNAIAALALVATAGSTGADLVLEQQRTVLAGAAMPESERQAKVALQQRIHQAVLTGKGWESLDPQLRRQADTPWFQSYLAFNPAAVLAKTRQPILILQGELDREVPPHHGQKLYAIAQARKKRKGQTASLVTVPEVDHLLVWAPKGQIAEGVRLGGNKLSRDAVAPLTGWLTQTIAEAVR